MKTITIPVSFLDLAKLENINTAIASDFYVRKSSSRGYYDLVLHMVPDFGSEIEASRSLLRLWKNWKSYIHNNSVVLEKTTVQVPEQISEANTIQKVIQPDSFLEMSRTGLERLIGPIGEVNKNYKRKKGDGSVDVAGDFHIPFHHPESLDYLLRSDADELVIMGDVLDMLSASSHRQTNAYVTYQAEIATGRAIIEELCKKYSSVKIITGNHDNRPIKKMQNLLPGLLPMVVHPLVWLTQGLDNVEFMSLEIPDTKPPLQFGENYKLDFAGIWNECLFGHFECFCGDDAVKRLDTWLAQWNHVLKIESPRAVFQGHVHRLSMEYTPTGRMLIHTGCMAKPQEYQFLQHGKYQPPVQGFVKMYRDETGSFDLNKTQLVYTG